MCEECPDGRIWCPRCPPTMDDRELQDVGIAWLPIAQGLQARVRVQARVGEDGLIQVALTPPLRQIPSDVYSPAR